MMARSDMKPRRITAGLARAEDVDRILEINQLEYGPHDILTTRADFFWRYEENPAGRASIVVVRDDHDQVIGFIWIVPLRVRIKGRDYQAATGTNLLIHPAYRNAFGYTKLLRRFQKVFDDNHIPLHFSFVSDTAYWRRQEEEPQTVCTIPLLVKPLDSVSLAREYFSRRWQGVVFGRIGRWLVSPLFFGQLPMPSYGDIHVEAVDQFDADFDEFWDQVQDRSPVIVVRDRAFLAWRFAPVSGRSYQILVARGGERMLGYAVLRCLTIRGFKTGLVMDLLVSNDTWGERAGACLMAEAEAFFRGQGMSVSVGLMLPSAPEYHILRRARYVQLPDALAPRLFRFAFFVHDAENKDLASLSAHEWFITIADYESY